MLKTRYLKPMLLSPIGKLAYVNNPSNALAFFKLIKRSLLQVFATVLVFLTEIITFKMTNKQA